MRSEREMLDLILNTAENDDRIRAVIMNGSRANPNARRDIFQDYDIVYVVTGAAQFRDNHDWIKRFGEMMIMQTPEDMNDPPPRADGSFSYLMQFTDGNRIDLTIVPRVGFDEIRRDSLSVVLLDKDRALGAIGPASESDYLPKPPTPKAFSDCCNEFWWVCTYVAKGLWREEIIYAKHMLDQIMRPQLLKMLTWHIGVRSQFQANPGAFGKYFEKYLEPELWAMLQQTYCDADIERNWNALLAMCGLFRTTALGVAAHFGFEYPDRDDARVTAHLNHVTVLPKDAKEMY